MCLPHDQRTSNHHSPTSTIALPPPTSIALHNPSFSQLPTMSSSGSTRPSRESFHSRHSSSRSTSRRSEPSRTHRSLPPFVTHRTRRLHEGPRVHDVSAQSSNDDFMEQIIVALDMRDKGRIGCAYYVASEGRLSCMEEVCGGGVDVLEKCRFLLSESCNTHLRQ